MIGDEEFMYRLASGEDITTEFYFGTKDITYRKYLLFGPMITKTEPKYAFHVDFDIESPRRTKDEVRKEVMKAYLHWKGLLHREEEIEKGEIM